MPKHLPDDLLERVQSELHDNPNGLALHVLEARLAGIASRRTLQRRLKTWQRKGVVRTEGVRRGRRYLLPSPVLKASPEARTPSPTAAEDNLPISTVGQEIRAFVRRPIADRPPIGYQRIFLDQYEPNVTQYLTETLRRHLHELGRTPDGERPAGTYARDILNRLLVDLSWSSSRLEGNTY